MLEMRVHRAVWSIEWEEVGSGGRRAVKSTVQVTAGEQQSRAAMLGGEEMASVTVRPHSWRGWWWAAGGGR